MIMKRVSFVLLMSAIVLLCGCSKDKDEVNTPVIPVQPTISEEIRYATQMARDLMESYYFWADEITSDVIRLNPDTCQYPIGVVNNIRYNYVRSMNGSISSGVDIDKWTALTNDFNSFIGSVNGVNTTYGWNITPYSFSNSNNIFYVVNFVYKDGPAEKAGIKRGDIILTVDGSQPTRDNFSNIYYSSSATIGLGTYDSNNNIISDGGGTRSLTAVEMYEDPILCNAIFDVNGKKVGYLAYASFDLKSASALVGIMKAFKASGVEELVLDLRYNGGGYVNTEELLGSMLAPGSDVINGKTVFHTEVYNKTMTNQYKERGEDLNTYFSTIQKVSTDGTSKTLTEVSIADAILSPSKIYFLMTSNTASASEGVIVGLSPYVPIEKIGNQSYGKYCTGWMVSSSDIYKTVPSVIKNWGMYLMVSTFADANGNNASRPDGFAPDYKVDDNPFDGYQLGDENETMLKFALTRAGKVYPEVSSTRSIKELPYSIVMGKPHQASFGMSIGFPKDGQFNLNK